MCKVPREKYFVEFVYFLLLWEFNGIKKDSSNHVAQNNYSESYILHKFSMVAKLYVDSLIVTSS